MVEYVGLDVSKEETAFCVKDRDGKVLASGKVATDPDALFAVLGKHYPGGVRLKRTGLRKSAIQRTSGRGKFAPLGEGGGAIELEIVTAVEMAFLVEVVVN